MEYVCHLCIIWCITDVFLYLAMSMSSIIIWQSKGRGNGDNYRLPIFISVKLVKCLVWLAFNTRRVRRPTKCLCSPQLHYHFVRSTFLLSVHHAHEGLHVEPNLISLDIVAETEYGIIMFTTLRSWTGIYNRVKAKYG